MLQNYLTIALRNLRCNPGYAFINIAGLTVGIACCLLILLYVRHELSYDRFHERADRIYRVVQEQRFGTVQQVAVAGGPVGPALVQAYPEVEAAVRFISGGGLMRYGDRQFIEASLVFADSNLFDVFTFPLLQGDPATALDQPNTIVLARDMAARYFGDEDPVGKAIHFSKADLDLLVTGVMENVPVNAHFTFDAVMSLSTVKPRLPWMSSWGSNAFWTYVLLKPGASPEALNAKLPDFTRKHRGEETVRSITYYLQPMPDIHLHSHMVAEIGANSDIATVYIFSAIALFILGIAAINYMNLATARSMQRMREVGVRKVLGAQRTQLIRQFLGESLLLTLLAVVGAVILAQLSLPAFNQLLGLPMGYPDRLSGIAGLLGFFLLVGLLSGAYPALHLSRFRPATVLKGTLPAASAGAGFRKALVVLQFTISIVLIAAVSVAYQQLRYVQQKHLGFDKAHLVNIRVGDRNRHTERMKQALEALPQVVSATATERVVGTFFAQTTYRPEGAPQDEEMLMSYVFVDPDFVKTMDMKMAAGRTFSQELASDSTGTVVLNETAARHFGWSDEEAIGRRILRDEEQLEVIGVVRDFHYASLHQVIEPLVMLWRPSSLENVTVRIRPENIPATLAALEQTWQQLMPGLPFDVAFVDERLDRLYRSDEKLGQLFGLFAALAVFIACLGLFGLASFTAERRVKEIGVRKVLGATVTSLVLLLSKDFTRLVIIAVVLAAPIAYFALSRWLADFAYHIEIGIGTFLLAGALALLIALGTVSYQAIRAALADPVESLRYE